jgi:hypothetical protein
MNQAIFKALYVCDETITTTELARPFTEIRELRNAIHGIASTTQSTELAGALAHSPRNAKAPVLWEEREPLDLGSISNVLVGQFSITWR